MLKVIKSVRNTLAGHRYRGKAAAWQTQYLGGASTLVHFAGFRVFRSLDTKRNFDDNNSFLTLLPLLFPPFVCAPGSGNDGPTLVLLALAKFVILSYPMHASGFSTTQLVLLHESAKRFVPVLLWF